VDILTSLLTSALRPEPSYRLPVPALLVHGERDQIGDIASTMRGWAEREPLARYAVIPDAGHASNLDNPDDFTDLLTAFIDDVAAEAAVKAQATRPHYREPVAAGIDGQGQPLLRAAS
jgi:3-oxoadipate enol-lactonase